MKELVLDLITSYENRVSTVEKLITTAYEAASDFDESFGELDRERERLKTSLQEVLAKNCSLRRKDFNRFIEGALFDSEMKRKEIEEKRKLVRGKLKEYLDEQKELVTCLRKQLVNFTQGETDNNGLETLLNNIKTICQDKGEQVFAMLRDFQRQLEGSQRDDKEINYRLGRLVKRDKFLRIEDMRQLEATKAHQNRKAERELRQQAVERLLAHFNQQRQGNNGHRQ